MHGGLCDEPELFHSVKYYGDVETKGPLTEGFTMIDYEEILKRGKKRKISTTLIPLTETV